MITHCPTSVYPEAALASRFDIKAFHRAVLENGALPLDVLDARINAWIAEQQTR